MIDLAIVGGRVIDPAAGTDGPGVVAVDQGRIVAPAEAADARRTIDATGLIVVPGLIDLHVHVYPGVSHYGVEPDATCLLRGVTTAVDAGSAGAVTFPGLRSYVIETRANSRPRVPPHRRPGNDLVARRRARGRPLGLPRAHGRVRERAPRRHRRREGAPRLSDGRPGPRGRASSRRARRPTASSCR